MCNVFISLKLTQPTVLKLGNVASDLQVRQDITKIWSLVLVNTLCKALIGMKPREEPFV